MTKLTPHAVIPDQLLDQSRRWRVSPGVRVGHLMLCSGQLGDNPAGTFSPEAEEQFDQAFRNVARVLDAGGASWADVVEMTTFHVDLHAHLRTFGAVRGRWVHTPWPAWSAIGVAALGSPNALVEIKVVACVRSAE
jgi:enamine deaminase RidA (YjgF/YER057c/UK114 family)